MSAESFFIYGPVGQLEAIMSPANEEVTPRASVAVICHPHPQQGGAMTNKVVTTLARAFAALGASSVRFNFRGVGKSAGEFADGIGEIDDVLAVVAWAKENYPQQSIWLAGFSFGAAMSAQAAVRVSVEGLVSIAPPVPRFHLLELGPVQCPWLIVQGDKDDVVVPQDVFAWVETREPKPTLIRMENAGHFFHSQLLELREIIETNLSSIA
jgi:alpha/beta superfamily hydrolase